MPRSYGITNALPASIVPAVGLAGDTYFNTLTQVMYISNGSLWLPVASPDGWISASSYTWLAAADNVILIQDDKATTGDFSFNVGTRIWCKKGAADFYGVVINRVGSAFGSPLPFVAVPYVGSTGVFTRATHGFTNGDVVYISTQSPGGTSILNNTPYFIVNTSGNTTFQLAVTAGGAAIVPTGANGTMTINGGTLLTLAPNADFGLTVGTALTLPKYSYAMGVLSYPGWFNYTTTQAVSPLVYTGYSAIPTGLAHQYRVDGNKLTLIIRETTNGTSSLGTLTMTAPVRAATVTNGSWFALARVVDNAATLATPGSLAIGSNSQLITANKDAGAGTWTASAGKRIASATLIYPI